MAPPEGQTSQKLRIVHCFRSPVGGIFRHVRDLIHEQVAQGHEIGVICDSNTGGAYEEGMLTELSPHLSLGLFRLPMKRSIGPRDISVTLKLYRQIKDLNLDVLHSHGAKGGAYARIIGSMLRLRSKRPVRLYCPHGGSVHYDAKTPSGFVYFNLERLMERFTDRLIFVSAYERDGYFTKVGKAHCPHSLARNGLTENEFQLSIANEDATDLVYIGMMRDLKGVDLFLDALPQVAKVLGKTISATLIGDGPDLDRYKQVASQFDKSIVTKFHDPMPVDQAFKMGKTLVVPSRAESLPYIVLEALAAQKPLIATNVGGIPEIYAENSGALVEPDNLEALTRAIAGHLSGTVRLPDSKDMALKIERHFSAKVMASDIMDAYRETLQS